MRTAPLFALLQSCRALHRGTVLVRILNVWVPRPATDGETDLVGQHSSFWWIMNGEGPIGAAHCQESSNISGHCLELP